MGDPRCWEAPEQTGPGKTCELNEICYTDLRISWGPYGKQLETISRGCARPRQNECHDNVMDHVHSKQCRHYCNTDIGCNGGLEIQEEFHSTKVQSCNLRIFLFITPHTFNTVKITLLRIFNLVSHVHSTCWILVMAIQTVSITMLILSLQNVPPTQMLVASQLPPTIFTMAKTVSPSPEDVLHLTSDIKTVI